MLTINMLYIKSNFNASFFLEVYKRWIQKNVFYLMEFWCCVVDVLLSFHPRKAVKVAESVMQPNDEVRGEYLHGRDCRGKGLKLVLWICTYLYTCIYIYIYIMH